MSNLIDKQAAIDLWDKYHPTIAVDAMQYDAELRQLPPAQREQHHDEWCTDCKEYDHENSCCPRWTKVIRQTRRELQDEFVMILRNPLPCALSLFQVELSAELAFFLVYDHPADLLNIVYCDP